MAELPYRPQYFDAGTAFNAGLRKPLNLGSEPTWIVIPALSQVGRTGAAVRRDPILAHGSITDARKSLVVTCAIVYDPESLPFFRSSIFLVSSMPLSTLSK